MGECEGFRKASISSFFTTTQLFDSDSVMSPTSILDTKPFSNLRRNNPPRTSHRVRKGLGIADVIALSDDENYKLGELNNSQHPESPKVVFGSQLKIQIPPLLHSPFLPSESPTTTPVEFGTKTRNPQLKLQSSMETVNSPRVVLSTTQMEMSEDYTCVISHGPIPKTTHIFDNCIVESCCGVLGLSASTCQSVSGFVSDHHRSKSCYPSQSFLSFCHTCKKQLELGKDIYMYRGENAFCSGECRSEKMWLEERMEK